MPDPTKEAANTVPGTGVTAPGSGSPEDMAFGTMKLGPSPADGVTPKPNKDAEGVQSPAGETPPPGAKPPEPGEPLKPGETPPQAAPKFTVAGREYTGDELVDAYGESSKEGRRLYQANQEATARVAALEAQLVDFQAMDEAPPFEILSDEKIEALSDREKHEYFAKKAQWDIQQGQRKDRMKQAGEARQAEAKQSEEAIIARSTYMESNPAHFPHFTELKPIMQEIMDRCPWVCGNYGAPDLLYLAAKGLKGGREQAAASDLEKKAADKVKAEAAAGAAATATGPGTGTAGAPPASGDEDSDEAFNARLLKKAPGTYFTE